MRDALHVLGAVTAGNGTTTYTADEIYLGTITAAYRRSLHAMGLIPDMFMRFTVTTVFSVGTSAQGEIVSDSTASSTTVVAASPVFLTATLALGYSFVIPVPLEVNLYMRGALLTVGNEGGVCNVALEFGPNIS